MKIIGYKTFHWTELQVLTGKNARTKEEIKVRPEDYSSRVVILPSVTDQKIMDTKIRHEGWYCLPVMEDGTADFANKFWDRKSRTVAVEKFYIWAMPKVIVDHPLSESEAHAFNNGYKDLNFPALYCMDYVLVQEIKAIA